MEPLLMMTKQKTMPKVLIVEDEALLNEAYQTILGKEGFEHKSAYNGEEALKILESFTPDVILLDLRMPKMNGIEFLKAFNDTKKKSIKIIIFSNYDVQKEIDEAFALGATRYMLKAWATPKELVRVVNDLLTA
jgi:CheY-like chemotaxis protein